MHKNASFFTRKSIDRKRERERERETQKSLSDLHARPVASLDQPRPGARYTVRARARERNSLYIPRRQEGLHQLPPVLRPVQERGETKTRASSQLKGNHQNFSLFFGYQKKAFNVSFHYKLLGTYFTCKNLNRFQNLSTLYSFYIFSSSFSMIQSYPYVGISGI